MQFAIELGLQSLAYAYFKTTSVMSFFVGVANFGNQAYQRQLALACEILVIQHLD